AEPIAPTVEIRGSANPIDARSFSANQRYLAVMERDSDKMDEQGFRHQPVAVWDLMRGIRVGQPLEHLYHNYLWVRLSLDRRLVVTASDAGTARVWDAARGVLRRELHHGVGINDASFSPNNRRVVTA